VFGLSRGDVRLALGKSRRAICQLCVTGFDTDSNSGICPDCIGLEPTPIQDNDPLRGAWITPRESPEITVARIARREAEMTAARYRSAMLFLHQYLAAIAYSRRLLPRDQRRTAESGLEQFAEHYPEITESMGLQTLANSPKL
jgi:hypothetical protein